MRAWGRGGYFWRNNRTLWWPDEQHSGEIKDPPRSRGGEDCSNDKSREALQLGPFQGGDRGWLQTGRGGGTPERTDRQGHQQGEAVGTEPRLDAELRWRELSAFLRGIWNRCSGVRPPMLGPQCHCC